MTVGQVLDTLTILSPLEKAESWDNVGLQIGGRNELVEQIILSLDVTSALVEQAKPHTLFIVHHPLLFSPLKKITYDDVTGRLIRLLIQKDCSLLAMHTNFDKTHLNRFVLETILGWTVTEEKDFILYADIEVTTFDNVLEKVKTTFHLEHPAFVSRARPIKRVALTTGSGGSLVQKVDADVYLTGDVKYHEALWAKESDLGIIDITHYASELFFGQALYAQLKSMPINVTIRNSINPFGKETL